MNWRNLLALATLCILTPAAIGQDKTEKKEAPAKVEMLELGRGKVVVAKPEKWKSVPAKSQMIESEFNVKGEGDSFARITIMQASGGIEGNIDRWVGQFDGAKKEDAKIEKKDVDQTKVHIVEIAGTFKESMGPGGPGAATKKQENYKMLGAILELKDGSMIFIKATGPKDIVGGMRESFVKMLDGLKNK